MTPEERGETLDRLYEDIRRALNNHEYDKAARLALKLTGELADDDFIRTRSYPACLECNGYAEVVDPEHPEKKSMCVSVPKACPGNLHGRMTPAQYQGYLDAKLAPRKPTVVEALQTPDAEGNVPKLPPDDQKPTPGASAFVDEPEPGKDRPPLVQS